LLTAQNEYLRALRSAASTTGEALERARSLVGAARARLRSWDVSDDEIAALDRGSEPSRSITIRSAVSGYVMEKNVVEGASVEPGMRLFRIAALDPVWVEAEVYESQLALVQVGQNVRASLPSTRGGAYDGRIAAVYPV